uniref:ribulose-phosphate 3-epimerase n=1 Tax=Euplotes harpa TaxID=151035 RepID=A0A7S3J3N2_9SPIT|mmetsp:Transcript_17907/g.20686  ORF Transcript_17907/g.20686 Transcript_17907/m.20686 type:complete len:205 (+) Transcript_17907:102-716(+)
MISKGCEWLHVDIMDGHFVPNLAIGFPVINSLKKAVPHAFLDCHVMASNPKKWVVPLKEAGGDQFVFHYETVTPDEIDELISLIKDNGMKVGMAIKPKTPMDETIIDVLKKDVLDMFLVMTVEPGFGGQSFMEETMDKVAQAREICPNLNIQVDGGVKKSNMSIPIKAGANVIVSGTGLFGQEDREDIINQMKFEIDEVTKKTE